MSTYSKKFATQRITTEDAWGPANVETLYQGLRNVAAIEEQKNCQWCHTLAGDGQEITSTYKICGWVKNHNVSSLGLYFVFRSTAAWSGDVLIRLTGIAQDLTLAVSAAGAGKHYGYLRVDYPSSGPQYGGRIQISSATAGLYLIHLGLYENETATGPDIYPDQIRDRKSVV